MTDNEESPSGAMVSVGNDAPQLTVLPGALPETRTTTMDGKKKSAKEGAPDLSDRDKVQVARPNRLEEWRRRRGFTLTSLAQRLDELGTPITFQRLSKLERGDQRLTAELLEALGNALSVDISQLVSRQSRVRLVVRGISRDGRIERLRTREVSMARVACPPGCDPDETEVIEIVEQVVGGVVGNGWLLFHHRLKDVVEADAVGQAAVCQLDSGEVVYGTLRAGAVPDRFHIMRPRMPPLLDQAVTAATRVRACLPKDLAMMDEGEEDGAGI